MRTQSLQAKLAESVFRAKITSQHLDKRQIFADEPNAKEFNQILHNRIEEAHQTFKSLHNDHLKLSPYLEIGSEYCQRASVLTNHFKADGFATDISLASLQAAPTFNRQFKFKKTPKRICTDAYNLPFKSDIFPFVFIYETLHHFPHPKPILKEIYRVLAPGGLCLIGSDPIKQELKIPLWNRPTKLRFWEKILKKIFILPFISQIGKTEIDYGIVETAFDLKTWQKSLSVFEKAQITIKAFPYGPAQTLNKSENQNWPKPKIITSTTLRMFGGGLTGYCYKKGILPEVFNKDLTSFLVCPKCLKNKRKEYSLKKNGKNLVCLSCNTIFQKNKNVLILLNDNLRNKILNA